jgi:hypothetical protein
MKKRNNRTQKNRDMSCGGRLDRGWRKWLIVGLVCSLSGFIAAGFAQTTKQMIVTPFQDARFVPLDAAQPEGANLLCCGAIQRKGPQLCWSSLTRA